MLARLLFLFIVVPLIELTLLLTIAHYTTVQFTLGMVLVTGIVGSLLARSQGWAAYRRIHREISAGSLPKESLLDALMILVAGVLLVTPGVITDLFGLSLLIPMCRRLYRDWTSSWIKRNFQVQGFSSMGAGAAPFGGMEGNDRIIDSYVVDAPNPDVSDKDGKTD